MRKVQPAPSDLGRWPLRLPGLCRRSGRGVQRSWKCALPHSQPEPKRGNETPGPVPILVLRSRDSRAIKVIAMWVPWDPQRAECRPRKPERCRAQGPGQRAGAARSPWCAVLSTWPSFHHEVCGRVVGGIWENSAVDLNGVRWGWTQFYVLESRNCCCVASGISSLHAGFSPDLGAQLPPLPSPALQSRRGPVWLL